MILTQVGQFSFVDVGHFITDANTAELSKPKKLQGELSEWVAPQLPDLPHRSFAQRARSKLGRVTPGDVDFSVKKVQWVLQTVIDVIDFMHNRLHGEPFARVYTHVTEFSELIGNETLRELSYVSQALELRSRLNEFFTHDLNPLDHEKQRFVDIFRKADRELVKLDNVLARFYNK